MSGLEGLMEVELLELQVPEGNLLGHQLPHLLAELHSVFILVHELNRPKPRSIGIRGTQRRPMGPGRNTGQCTGARGGWAGCGVKRG